MNEQLIAMNSEFANSGILVDFVFAMVENQKPKDYVITQLSDITTESEAKSIADWLFDYLGKPKMDTNNRAFQIAFNQAGQTIRKESEPSNVDDINMSGDEDLSDPKDLRQLLSSRRNLSPSRNDRRSNRSSPYSRDKRPDRNDRRDDRDRNQRNTRDRDHRTSRRGDYNSLKEKFEDRKPESIPKCTFFPNCTKEECPFFHPTEPCPDENCTKGPACRYIHQVAAATPQFCRFREHCTRPDCAFAHPSPASIKLAQSQTPCRFAPNCINPQCPFLHPAIESAINTTNDQAWGESTTLASSVPGGPKSIEVQPSSNATGQTVMITCRFDPRCMRQGCHFFHPSRQGSLPAAGSKNKTLIINDANKVHPSERTFALDQPVERIDTTMEVDM
ncbi:hypothetical protein BC833DRAFT_600608 [Globomyces pollinis-pini]|nr:hypothetical protein BC833DRAFT_600608 [Globomyces pollinis-pini]